MTQTNAPLHQRHAVITGASRGIGAAVATQLAQAGANVTLMGRDSDSLKRLAQLLGTQVRTHIQVVDLADTTTVQTAMQENGRASSRERGEQRGGA